jgi:hypothetical protein
MTVTDAKKATDKILAKIRKLLAQADGTDNEHEASAFRAHAEKLMREYRVAEEQLIAADPDSIAPVITEVDLCTTGTQFYQRYADMMFYIARHTGCRVRMVWVAPKDRPNTRVLRAFLAGYEADTRYADLLFTTAQLVFQEKLEPQVDPKLDDRENVYRLRSAGIERNRIARLLWNLDTHASHAKVGTLYREACELRGTDAKVSGRNINAKNYRELYAEEFAQTLGRRLRRAQDAADSSSGVLVLAGRSERVDEAFYDRFPEERPSTSPAKHEPCPVCKPNKPCRIHKLRAWTKADDERYERRHNSPTARLARQSGAEAAHEVELRGVTSDKRLEQ